MEEKEGRKGRKERKEGKEGRKEKEKRKKKYMPWKGNNPQVVRSVVSELKKNIFLYYMLENGIGLHLQVLRSVVSVENLNELHLSEGNVKKSLLIVVSTEIKNQRFFLCVIFSLLSIQTGYAILPTSFGGKGPHLRQ